MNTRLTIRSLAAALCLLGSSIASAATITIVNADGPNEGFNDPTPVVPVGGNPGTTLGEQRLEVFRYAASVWGARIASPVEIRVEAQFDPLDCNAGSAVLGAAGTTTVHRDFAGAELAATWYPQALANAMAGTDLDPVNPDLGATFNSGIDNNDACLSGVNWYLGLDGNNGGDIDLADVVIHEIGHGLGFASYVNESTGQPFLGYLDVFSINLEDHSLGLSWDRMSDIERVVSAVDSGDLHFVGPNVVAAAGHVPMYAPDPLQPGSSVSHFDVSMTPDELMEPFITDPPIHEVGLAFEAMLDLGWLAEGQPVNMPPSVLISSPSDGDVFSEGGSVSLLASAEDAEDGDLSGSIRWSSDRDGLLGIGASLSVSSLSVGDHLLSASVSDSAGASASDQVSISVEGEVEPLPAVPGPVGVTDQGDGSALVAWQDNSDNEQWFEIQRESPHKRRPGVWVGTTLVGTVAADVTSLTDNSGAGTFRYCVRAGNASGSSDWACSEATVITDSGSGDDGSTFCDKHPTHKRCL